MAVDAEMIRNRPFIAVCGEGRPSAHIASLADEVGRLLGERGAVVVTGGLGGVMEAASRGAKTTGGLTVGILPGSDRTAANAYVDIPVPTSMSQARNLVVVNTAQSVIAIGGEYGTLSEIALALKCGIPVVGLETWSLVKGGEERRDLHVAATPAEAVEMALDLARRQRPGSGR